MQDVLVKHRACFLAQNNSSDLSLAREEPLQPLWKNPAGSQRTTRQWLLSVINACVPIPVLMSSPSVSLQGWGGSVAEVE